MRSAAEGEVRSWGVGTGLQSLEGGGAWRGWGWGRTIGREFSMFGAGFILLGSCQAVLSPPIATDMSKTGARLRMTA